MAQYTEKAQEALVLASEAAEDMGSPVIGTEHILVGLIEEGSGTAAMVLEANEVKQTAGSCGAACLFLSEYSHQRAGRLHSKRETCAGKRL